MIPATARPEAADPTPILKLCATAEPASPIQTFVTHMRLNGASGTVVGRTWAETRFRTCGNLCDEGECTFDRGRCQVGVEGHVPADACSALAKRTHAG